MRGLWLPLGVLALSRSCWGAAADGGKNNAVGTPQTPTRVQKQCAPLDQQRVLASNLSAGEAALLQDICWRGVGEEPQLLRAALNDGIPAGVSCNATRWCDEDICTTVCERGSVVVDPWLRHAVRTQLRLARRLPLCLASLLGSHNSGITLADGYGNQDPQWREYFAWIRYVADDAGLRTSNQWLSLTDQLRLGVRAIELDTHWVEGELRIAHCGGLHVAPVNALLKTLNVVARLLGHPIRWDTETAGCEPSLSSLPVRRQRSLTAALEEISAWLDAPENEEEFLVLFLDDQTDLAAWGKVAALLEAFIAAFGLPAIYTPAEHAAWAADTRAADGAWPSIDDLSAAGKRLLVVTAADLGPGAAAAVFDRARGGVCGWTEPPLGSFVPYPKCALTATPPGALLPRRFRALNGTLLRTGTCELLYGPFNCEFLWGDLNEPLLDEASLPAVTRCGLSQPCPDSITPERVAATIWSWALGEPKGLGVERPKGALWGTRLGSGWGLLQQGLRILERWLGFSCKSQEQCAAVSGRDGRWRVVGCSDPGLPLACRTPQGAWAPSAPGARACPGNSMHSVPRHARDNADLQTALQADSSAPAAAIIALRGPDWLAAL